MDSAKAEIEGIRLQFYLKQFDDAGYKPTGDWVQTAVKAHPETITG